jgi:hypothetical protein
LGRLAAALGVATLTVGLVPAVSEADSAPTPVNSFYTAIVGDGGLCMSSTLSANPYGYLALDWDSCSNLTTNLPAIQSRWIWKVTNYSNGRATLEEADHPGTCAVIATAQRSDQDMVWTAGGCGLAIPNIVWFPGTGKIQLALNGWCLQPNSSEPFWINPATHDFGCPATGNFSFAPALARLDFNNSCPNAVSTAVGAGVALQTHAYSFPQCPWLMAYQSGSTTVFTMMNTNGYCLDSSYGGVAANTPLVQGVCNNASGGQTWRILPGVRPGSIRYQQLKSGRCATPVSGNLELEDCDVWSDFVNIGPLKHNLSHRCVALMGGSTSTLLLQLTSDCTTSGSIWAYNVTDRYSGQLHQDPRNPNGDFCLGPYSGYSTPGEQAARLLCGAPGTAWTTWKPIAGTQPGTTEFKMGSLCLTTDTGMSNLFLGTCNTALADFS